MSSNPQTFNIVKCYNCSIYQVDINKKSTNKWSCKLCGAKQTLKQVFYESDSAKDCRERVKQLNSLNGQRKNEQEQANLARHDHLFDDYHDEFSGQSNVSQVQSNKSISKWAKYLTKKEFDKYYGQNQQDISEDEEPTKNQNKNNFY